MTRAAQLRSRMKSSHHADGLEKSRSIIRIALVHDPVSTAQQVIGLRDKVWRGVCEGLTKKVALSIFFRERIILF